MKKLLALLLVSSLFVGCQEATTKSGAKLESLDDDLDDVIDDQDVDQDDDDDDD